MYSLAWFRMISKSSQSQMSSMGTISIHPFPSRLRPNLGTYLSLDSLSMENIESQKDRVASLANILPVIRYFRGG